MVKKLTQAEINDLIKNRHTVFLRGMDLTGINLAGAYLSGADLRRVDLARGAPWFPITLIHPLVAPRATRLRVAVRYNPSDRVCHRKLRQMNGVVFEDGRDTFLWLTCQ